MMLSSTNEGNILSVTYAPRISKMWVAFEIGERIPEEKLVVELMSDNRFVNSLRNKSKVKIAIEIERYQIKIQNIFEHLLIMATPTTSNEKLTKEIEDSIDNGNLNEFQKLFGFLNDKQKELCLFQAVVKGKLEILKWIWDQKVNINAIDDDGWTPLMFASYFENLEILKYLTSEKFIERISIDAIDNHGRTALHLAVVSNKNAIEIVKLLLSKGSNPKIFDKYNRNAILRAAELGRLEVVKYFIEELKFDPKEKNNRGWDCLFFASCNEKVDICDFLISIGCKIGGIYNEGRTALHIAAQSGSMEVVKYLISKGLDPNSIDQFGLTPFMIVSANGKLDVVEYLISIECKIHTIDNEGRTALHLAAQNGTIEVVKYLISQGFDSNSVDKNDWNALMHACRGGKLEIVKHLIEEVKCNPIQRNNQGIDCFMIASSNGHIQLSDYLISIGCKIDVVEKHGNSALFYAAGNGNLKGVKYLTSKGLDPNLSPNDGLSPFMTCVYLGKLEIVKYFVEELKCDPNQISKDGKNALSIAIGQTQDKISEYLISKIDIKIMIVHALQHQNLEVLKFMHSKGVDLNISDEQGLNSLMVASSNRKLEIVKYFVEELKCDPNQTSKDGKNALSISIEKDHQEIADYLFSIINHNITTFNAIQNDQIEVLKFIHSKGVDLNISDEQGLNSLVIASSTGKLEILKYLISLKCDPNQISKDGKTALSIAIEKDHKDIADYLFSIINHNITIFNAIRSNQCHILKFIHLKEVDLNISNEQGSNRLMFSFALSNGKLEIVKFLIEELKFDPNQISKDGKNVLSISIEKNQIDTSNYLILKIDLKREILNAIQNDQIEVLKFIHSKGIDLNISDEQGLNSLMIASSTGKLEILKYLVSVKCDPNQTNNEFQTCLHISAFNNQLEIVKYLFSIGCNPIALDKNKRMPIDLAKEKGHQAIVDYLGNIPQQYYNEMRSATMEREIELTNQIQQLEMEVNRLKEDHTKLFANQKSNFEKEETERTKLHLEQLNQLRKLHTSDFHSQIQSKNNQIDQLKLLLNNSEADLTKKFEQQISELKESSAQQQFRHQNELTQFNLTQKAQISELNTSHSKEISELKDSLVQQQATHDSEIAKMKESFSKELLELDSSHKKAYIALSERFDNEILALKKMHDQSNSDLQETHLQEIHGELEKSNEKLNEQSKYYEQLLTDSRKDRQNSLSNLQIELESKWLSELNAYKGQIENLRDQLAKEEIRKSFQYQRQIEDLEQQLKIEANSSKTINIREVDCEKDLPAGIFLGDGGFGKVFKSKLGIQNVAVKTIKLEDIEANDLPKIKESFEKELEILNRARHPNIVNVVGACKHIEHLSIVLELAERGSLYRYLHQTNGFKFSEEQSIRILIDIGNGMNYLHQFKPQIIHRDLKSDNILLFSDWTAKVTDFGLSKLKETSSRFKSSTNHLVGTVNWMAPEMFDDDLAKTDKVDVYSFGMVIYEMLSWSEKDRTHLKPWSGKSEHVIISSVAKQQRPPLPIAKDPIIELMKKCWAQSAQERPSFSVVVHDLERLKSGLSAFVDWKLSPDLLLNEGWKALESSKATNTSSTISSSRSNRALSMFPLPLLTPPTVSNNRHNNAINVIHNSVLLEYEKLNSILKLLHGTTSSTIEQAHVIDNSTIQGSFESRMDTLNSKKLENNLRASWRNLSAGQFRESLIHRLNQFAEQWKHNQNNGNPQMIPMFHGLQDEKSGWSIAGTGFSSLQTDGYFGSGIYFTTNLEYACKYVKQPTEMAGGKQGYWIMLSWVLVGNVFPVIELGAYHGKPLEAGYDAHWTMVKAHSAEHGVVIPGSFIPVKGNEPELLNENLTELVVNQESQCLPMYLLYVTK